MSNEEKIKVLETQLELSHKNYNKLNKMYVDLRKAFTQKCQDYSKLKYEFNFIDDSRIFNADMWSRFANKCKDLSNKLNKRTDELNVHKNAIKNILHNCDTSDCKLKINFTLNEFIKAREYLENLLDKAIKNCSINMSYYDKLLDYFDDKILELKEKK